MLTMVCLCYIPQWLVAFGAGLFVSHVLGGAFLRYYFDRLCAGLSKDLRIFTDDADPTQKQVGVRLQRQIGHVERMLYLLIAYFQRYEILTGWFALKAIVRFGEMQGGFGAFRSRQSQQKAGADELQTRYQLRFEAEYHKYFLGCGTSLLFGLAGGWIARKLMGFSL